jgi:hypothetical protein
MKLNEVCLLQGGMRPGKADSIELPPRDLPADILSIVALLLIGTGLIVNILGGLPKKNVAPKADTAQLNAQTTEQRPVETKPEPALFDPTARSTSGYRSSLPSPSLVIKGFPGSHFQEPSSVIKGFPGSPYQPPVTSTPALRRFAPASDAKQRSAVGKKPAENRHSTRKWPKALISYLGAHQNGVRKILRRSETAAFNARK